MNNVTLVGRVVFEPELKNTESGTALLPLRIAVNRGDKDKTVDFINCQAWSATAEFIAKYFHKGDPIAVCGKLQTRSWEKQDGTKANETYVNIRDVAFVPGKSNNSAVTADSADGDLDEDDFEL